MADLKPTDLKPCPFCGSSVSVTSRNHGVDSDGHFFEYYDVECRNCGGNTGKSFRGEFFRKNGEFYIVKDGYADAVAAWNRREGGT